uniref:Uncharacterized protein n=1 Tax=Opuntia streptacantha TaxID=393608 RepID=A0A7C8ZNM3_OPUST
MRHPSPPKTFTNSTLSLACRPSRPDPRTNFRPCFTSTIQPDPLMLKLKDPPPSSARRCPRPGRAPGASGPGETGPPASSSNPPRPSPALLRSGAEVDPAATRQVLGRPGSACTAPRRRPHSGGRGPWGPRRCATRAGCGTSRGGWCPSTDPPRARRSWKRSTRIHIGR